MPIYKQTTEITNIDDLLSSVERDIEEVYFGDKQVFTVWGEYDGTLPAQYSANGSTLADYRVYGSSGGVGDKTENLFDKNAKNPDNGFINNSYLSVDGGVFSNSTYYVSEYIEIEGSSSITFAFASIKGVYTCFYNSEKQITGQYDGIVIRNVPMTVTVPSSAKYMRMSVLKSIENTVCVVEGSTAPTEYIPFGYEVDMGVKTDNLLSMDDILVGYWESSTTGWIIIASTGNYRSTKTAVSAGTYTFSFSNLVNVVRIKIGETWIYDGNDPAPEYQNITSLTITANTDTDIGISARNAQSAATPWGDTTIELVKSNTTPIYIGDEPLGEDEYVDYAAGKVYRRTENLWNEVQNDFEEGYTINVNTGLPSAQSGRYTTLSPIPINNNEYCISYSQSAIGKYINVMYSILLGETFIRREVSKRSGEVLNTSGGDRMYICFYSSAGNIDREEFENIMLVEGSTAPSAYIPYLQPTAPPVPLPALPTVDGTTITDYAGQSAAVPERFVAKYRKEGFN